MKFARWAQGVEAIRPYFSEMAVTLRIGNGDAILRPVMRTTAPATALPLLSTICSETSPFDGRGRGCMRDDERRKANLRCRRQLCREVYGGKCASLPIRRPSLCRILSPAKKGWSVIDSPNDGR